MKINNQVTSIEKSLRLKELGAPQTSAFFYENLTSEIISYRLGNVLCSAYLAEEILAEIPDCIEKDGFTYGLSIEKYEEYFVLELSGNQIDNVDDFYTIKDKQLTEVFALLWIYLIENEFIRY